MDTRANLPEFRYRLHGDENAAFVEVVRIVEKAITEALVYPLIPREILAHENRAAAMVHEQMYAARLGVLPATHWLDDQHFHAAYSVWLLAQAEEV